MFWFLALTAFLSLQLGAATSGDDFVKSPTPCPSISEQECWNQGGKAWGGAGWYIGDYPGGCYYRTSNGLYWYNRNRNSNTDCNAARQCVCRSGGESPGASPVGQSPGGESPGGQSPSDPVGQSPGGQSPGGQSPGGQSPGVPGDCGPLIITGVINGAQVPMAIELYVGEDIPDLSVYSIGVTHYEAGGSADSDGPEFTFPADQAFAGQFIWVTYSKSDFQTFFEFPADYEDNAFKFMGSDVVELFKDGDVVDMFGELGEVGNDQPWAYYKGWARRYPGTGPDATFQINNWRFSGKNALDQNRNRNCRTPLSTRKYSCGRQSPGGSPYGSSPDSSPRSSPGSSPASEGCPDLVLTGVVTGGPSGVTAIELWAGEYIPDLSVYGLGVANNGGSGGTQEFTFPADALQANSHIWVTRDMGAFENYFEQYATYQWNDPGNSLDCDGDDAVELFKNGNVHDTFGDPSFSRWDYSNGWAYRKLGTGPDGSLFKPSSWVIKKNALLQGLNSRCLQPFPIEDYMYPCGFSPNRDSPNASPFVSFRPSPDRHSPNFSPFHSPPGDSPEPSQSPDQCFPIDEEIGGFRVSLDCPYGVDLLEKGICYVTCGVVVCPGYDETGIAGLCNPIPTGIHHNPRF